MEKLLKKILEKNKNLAKKGKVADYIPALKEGNPEDLGICIFDIENNFYKLGDYNKKFTIQSISKVIALMLVLEDLGEEEVFKRVGLEGTDDNFNSLYKLDMPYIDKPANPMINSGAIVITSMIKGSSYEEKFNRLMNFLKKMTSNNGLAVNKRVYLSEKETGNKNRAMAYLMKNKGIIQGDVEEILNIYFRQCSIEVDCEDLGNIGLVLANDGKKLDTGEKIVSKRTTEIVRAIMATSGMYNASGKFALEVGFPAKSGVAGGVLGVVPKRMGIGVYSPPLDSKGNSIASIGVLKDLSRKLNLRIY